jgi:cytochrome P450
VAEVQGSYLDRFDAAAPADRFPLVRRWIDQEPLAFFKELREKRPILVTPVCTLVSRFDEVTEVLNMPKVFTVALYLPKMQNGIYLMAHDDDALHSREKAVMQSLLNRDDLPQVRQMVGQFCREILGASGGKLEAIGGYCRRVPAMLVQKYFGLVGVSLDKLIAWSYAAQADTFYNQPFDLISDARRKELTDNHDRTGKELGQYITELVIGQELLVNLERARNFVFALWYLMKKLARTLMGNPPVPLSDTIVTRMIRTAYPDPVAFDIKRLGINAGGLLVGAIETTSQAVAQVIQYLLDRPDLLAQAVDAARADAPAAIDGIVWECLRFVPISPYLFRQAAADYTIGKGTDHPAAVKAGSYVLAVTQSAMFDPRAFENPEAFVPGRNWYHYFHFGFGSHECLGKYIGMVMIPEMVRQILRVPGLRALGKIDYQGGHLPERYDLTWSPA